MKRTNSGKGGASEVVLTPVWLVTFIVTIGVWYWVFTLRAGIFDPYGVSIYWHLFFFQDYWAALAMLAAMPLALLAPARALAGRCVDWVGRHQELFAFACVVAVAAGAKMIYHAYPLSLDEYSAWLQARVFASGHLTGQIPPVLVDWVVPDRFQGRFINVAHDTGRIAAVYWPGFALLLAPFSALGIPWLLNPLVTGGVLLLIARLTTAITGNQRAAGLAMLLAAGSQSLSVNGMSFYSMNAHLLVNLAFAALLLEPDMRRAVAAGLVGSIGLTLHNPVPHLLFAAPWIAWLLFKQRQPKLLAGLIAGYLPLSLLLGVGWQLYSSSVFGAEYMGQGHPGFVLSWTQKIRNVFGMPTYDLLLARLVGVCKVWLWSVPGLLLLAFVGFWRRRSDGRVVVLALSAATTLIGFMFVPFDQGHGWGFRYFGSAWGLLPVLAAIACVPVSGDDSTRQRAASNEWQVVAALAASWLIIGSVLRAWQVDQFITDHLAQLPGGPDATATVRIVNPGSGYYAWDLVQNDPFLRGDVILVSHGRKEDAAMMAREYPALVLQSSKYRGQVWAAAQ